MGPKKNKDYTLSRNLKINSSMNREEQIKHMFYGWDEGERNHA